MLKPTGDGFHALIADSAYLITESVSVILKRDFGFPGVRIETSAAEAARAIDEGGISLVIYDPRLIDPDNVIAREILSRCLQKIPVLVLTDELTRAELSALHGSGVRNILLKSAGREEFNEAMRALIDGRKHYGQEILELFSISGDHLPVILEITALTAAETEIVRLIADGKTTKEIAAIKHISFHTVMTHRKNIFRKLQVNSASELVMHAIRKGIIDTLEYNI